jgi:hypothetical protein
LSNRLGLEAYNRAPAPISRQAAYSRPTEVSRGQTYARPESRLAYGPEYYNGGGSERGYAAPAQAYRGTAMQASRGSNEAFGRSDFGGRSSQSFGSQSFKEPKSSGGGFHLFGGGGGSYKEPSFKEPKFKEPKFKEPKMSSKGFGGGGHSSGHGGGGKHRG